MGFIFGMPKLSPTMEEGTIVKWQKKEGDFVEAGETLLEIATDKATVEHAALDEGYLRKILVQEEGVATINQPIALFTEGLDEAIPEVEIEVEEEEAPPPEEEKPPPAPKAETVTGPSFVPEPPLEEYAFRGAPEGRVVASPLAKKIAKEEGLDLSTLQGSGPGGRITREDLARAQPKSSVAFDRHEMPTEVPGSYEEETLTPMRKIVGQRLQQAKTFVPHFYVSQEIDAGALVALREQLKSYGVKVSFNDLIVRATALTLRQYPELNSGFNTETHKIIRFKTIDISIAVSVEGGLITPVVRHADYKSVGQLSVEIKELSKKARAGKLMPEEYKGGSFTISNLGMFGVSSFIAVINPPQSSILAISGIRDLPVVREGRVEPGKVMTVTISCDHRVVDGLDAAKFLGTLKECLEAPTGLLVG